MVVVYGIGRLVRMLQVGRIPPPGRQGGFGTGKGGPRRHAGRLAGIVDVLRLLLRMHPVVAIVLVVLVVAMAAGRLRKAVVTGIRVIRVKTDAVHGRSARFADPLQGAVTALAVTIVRRLLKLINK